MLRARRQQRVLDILAEGPVRSQAELVRQLEAEGLGVTQATLSRDLAELGVVKSAAGYQLPDGAGAGPVETPAGRDRMSGPVRQAVVDATAAAALVVVRTRPGWADAVASEFDRRRPEGLVGTIAGDDTIFLAVRSAADAERLAAELEALVLGRAAAPASS